ncbi:hypothetical protein O181_080431 [Austropuccinia psidii MF-1]|uniref:DUF202 domain-containing protein n=1 Tax=Austropuccinia psidii MF-1 TaxID=1389203 RepID=A0A9Q3IEY2_9BASI|nr:hypothetical protein [Austropuccinia psidii MF-1]
MITQSFQSPAPADYGATSQPSAPGTSKSSNLTKIEPKVWLANERTWLHWCRTGVLLGTFGVALVNCSPSLGARIMGGLYSALAIGIISYGYWLYRRRMELIKKRHSGHFDAVFAPLIIASLLFMAILLNFALRIADKERHYPLLSQWTPTQQTPLNSQSSYCSPQAFFSFLFLANSLIVYCPPAFLSGGFQCYITCHSAVNNSILPAICNIFKPVTGTSIFLHQWRLLANQLLL